MKTVTDKDPESPELPYLQRIDEQLDTLNIRDSSRYQLLKRQLDAIGWDGKANSPRVLVFTEYRETQDALAAALAKDFKIKYSPKFEQQPEQALATINGSCPDIHLMKTVEAFGTGASDVRMLLATDVASEGVNLHHQCHNIIHYDLPWSIITLIQRNGRIDRFGQLESPVLRYLRVRTSDGMLKGDESIFERLIEKVEEINRSTRQGETVLKLYDPEAEERYIAKAGLLAGNVNVLETPATEAAVEATELETVLSQANPTGQEDFLKFLLGETVEAPAAGESETSSSDEAGRLRLYDDKRFLLEGYRYLADLNQDYVAIEETGNLMLLTAPKDLRRRLGSPDEPGDVVFGATAIPIESWPDDHQFRLTDDPEQVELAIKAARNTSGHWSKELLCTDQQPILRWITERLLMLMKRGECPHITSRSLEPGELCFCFIGQVSSRAGAPLVVDAHAVSFRKGGGFQHRSLREALDAAGFERLVNEGNMFADQDLIHVKPAGKETKDKKTPTWFVPKERLDEFQKDEVERSESGASRVYKKGEFILHLNGIDREQSASYYTPEVLTQCLVEEALRELLKDYRPADADKILDLKICEPAMGSGAFLNEAAEQLAHRYLELKQKQIDQTIEPAHHGDELRRVKHYITTRNVYGVDLNPTAVELGALSLWLDSIHRLLQKKGENGGRDEFVCDATPWFGLRLRCGNSLIGARRAVWTAEQLKNGKHGGKNSETPRLLKAGEERDANEIYHFLVFDEDMVPTHTDRLMKSFWPERCAAAKTWITRQVKPKWKKEEADEALAICKLIDAHWKQYSQQRAEALEKTACIATVWPVPSNCPGAVAPGPSLDKQERVCAELESTSGSFQRLRLVMDTWCALWFWPLDRVSELPSRGQALASARLLLMAESSQTPGEIEMISAGLDFDIKPLLNAAQHEILDTDLLADGVPWFGVAETISGEQHFHHWELVFVEVLGAFGRDGFHLILGNPPWLKASWEDALVLSELEPKLGVWGSKSATVTENRAALLQPSRNRSFYTSQFQQQEGMISILNSVREYAELAGIQTNLYKNFIVKSWSLIARSGIAALLHPEGAYDDPRGGTFRSILYRHLRAHFQFHNEKKLFADIGNTRPYSINVYGATRKRICFSNISNLFLPHTVRQCFCHEAMSDPIPGIKDDANRWIVRPHAKRIVQITELELTIFNSLLEGDNSPPSAARLPQIHATPIVDVIRKITQCPNRLDALNGKYYSTVMIDETYGQRDGIITRNDSPSFQPMKATSWVVSGPHFYVASHGRISSSNSREKNSVSTIIPKRLTVALSARRSLHWSRRRRRFVAIMRFHWSRPKCSSGFGSCVA